MYIAVKGGEAAIAASEQLLQAQRRGDPALPPLGVAQLTQQLRLLVARVMAEASLFDAELAALALQQAQGDVTEAVFLLRAYRSTLPRLQGSLPLALSRLRPVRRISAVFKDLPGGQVLGPSFDYTQRLLDFSLLAAAPSSVPAGVRSPGLPGLPDAAAAPGAPGATTAPTAPTAPTEHTAPTAPTATDTPATPRGEQPGPPGQPPVQGQPQPPLQTVPPAEAWPSALATLVAQGLVEPCALPPGDPEPPDITRHPPIHPLGRAARLQMLARADEGWLLGLGYATQRGYAHSHPFVGELRVGWVPVEIVPPELGFAITVGELEVTDCQLLTHYRREPEPPEAEADPGASPAVSVPAAAADAAGDGGAAPPIPAPPDPSAAATPASALQPPRLTRGQGLVAGHNERKAMAMALVDRALRAAEFGETLSSPAQDGEFVLSHGDSVEASGFVQHLKLPHYVTFEAELQLLRALRENAAADVPGAGGAEGRAPGCSQAGPHPLGGSADVPDGRGAEGRAPGRSQAGPHPLGGSADVPVGRGANSP